MSTRPLDLRAIVLMLMFCFSLGINQVTVKIALHDIPPLIQAAGRSAGAALILGVLALATDRSLLKRDRTLLSGIAVGLVFAAEFIVLYLGLQWTTASHAVLFLYTAPFFVALGLLIFVPDERLRALQWVGLILAFVGVVCALGSSLFNPPSNGAQSADRTVLIGDLFCLAGGIFWAGTTLIVKATNLRYASPTKVLLYQLVVSAVVIGAAAALRGEHWPQAVLPSSVASMLYQTFWIGCVAFVLWFWLLQRYRAGELSAFTFLTPVIGVFAGWLWLGDRLSLGFMLALCLVAAGILLVNWQPRRAKAL